MLFSKIKELCKANEISIARLEKAIGMSNGSIRKWEKGYPGLDKALSVADYFGISIDELAGRNIYSLSDDSKNLAAVYESLPKEKQALVKCYLSVIQN